MIQPAILSASPIHCMTLFLHSWWLIATSEDRGIWLVDQISQQLGWKMVIFHQRINLDVSHYFSMSGWWYTYPSENMKVNWDGKIIQ